MLKSKTLMISIFLAVATFVTFWRVNYCDFINFDDPLYITENSHIMNGVTGKAILWAFTTTYACFWHPLTMISHMVDVQLFGLNPHRHHLTSLLLHVANTMLLFLTLNRATKAPWKSAFVAALFALHPLHVESVAWVAERKDVLCTLFWMLTMIAYVYYVEHPRLSTYLPVFAFFALGLMAKPMLVTLPFVLLLLDYWPLQRFERKRLFQRKHTALGEPGAGVEEREAGGGQREPVHVGKEKGKPSGKNAADTAVESEKSAGNKYRWTFISPLFLEKVPLFFLAVIASVIVFITEQEGGAVRSLGEIPLSARVANAIVSYAIYIEKMFWPAKLAMPYTHPGLSPLWQVLGASSLLLTITIAVIRMARRLPSLCVGWLWFIGTLVPVIGIVQVGYHAMADRYTYIPLIGLFIMAAWGIPEILKNSRFKAALIALSALIISSLSVITWIQVGYWMGSLTLFDHTLSVTNNNYAAYYNRGNAYKSLGNPRRAILDYNMAITIIPNYASLFNNRAASYYSLGNYRKALVDYNKAIEIDPKFADAYSNRGVTYADLGSFREAIADYDKAIEINPMISSPYYNRGHVYASIGDYKQAIFDYTMAINLNPKRADVYNNRGNAYASIGNHKRSIIDYDISIKLNPTFIDAYNNRGNAYEALGNYEQAIADYDRAIEINPTTSEIYNNRGYAYAVLGNQEQAIVNYDRAIEINPKFTLAYANRANAYAKLGNNKQAVEDMKTAAKLGSEEAKNLLKSQGITW